jgi:HEAT repeat protein
MNNSQGLVFTRLRQTVASGVATEQEKIDFAVMAGELNEVATRDLVYRLSSDESENVRYYALRTLVLESLDRSPAAEERCWQLFESDPNSRVRSMAASCIGSLRSASKDPATFKRLKRRVAEAADRFEAELVLEALYNIAGRPPREWPTQRRILSGRIGASPPEIDAQVSEAAELEKRYLSAST